MPHIRSLHEGEELVRRILDAVPGGVVHVAKDGAIVGANEQALRIAGQTFEELSKPNIGAWIATMVREDGSPCTPENDCPVAKVFTTHEASPPETLGLRRPDGELVWAVFRAVRVNDESGAIAGAIVSFIDITERKRTEEKLRRSEEKWRVLAANVPDFVTLVDRDAQFLSVNRVLPELDEAAVLRTRIWDYLPPESVNDYRARFERAIATRSPERFENRGHGVEGARTWYETIVVPLVEDDTVERVLVVAREITARKQAEDQVRASEQRWRALVDNLPDTVFVVDRAKRILSINRVSSADSERTNYSEQVLGVPCDEFVDEAVADDWRSTFEGVLATGTAARLETRGRSGPGGRPWYDSIMVPLTEGGEVRRVMIVARDITDRRAMLASLAEKERLASVGMVAASVAHEIMNPLTYVLANLDFALGDRPMDDARRTKSLAEAREGAKRMQQIVWDLRSLGRAGGEELFYVDARSVLESALRLSGPEVGRAARVVLDLQEVPGVLASESRLCQVFINLLVNAAQSMEARPLAEREILVRTRHDDVAGLVAVEIADRGVGIAHDRLERIFEPFYTTKGSGTGLGLSISHDIVERMGGKIAVESTPGAGTTFTVWLSTTRSASAAVAE